jgi:3(or 17)beta-hydroxysteroid dehydrogenase
MLKHFVKREFGNLDGLVNNAGWRFIYGDTDDIEKIRVEAWKDISAVLLDGSFLGCKYGLELMKDSRSAEGTTCDFFP